MLSDLYNILAYCFDCDAPITGHVDYSSKRGQNTFKIFKKKPGKLKHRCQKHRDVYALQSIINLIDRND